MARRIFTYLVFALGFLSFNASTAQQTSFALSPTTVSPNVGDTIRLSVVVNGFDSLVSFQYGLDWDASLLQFVSIDQRNMPDAGNLQSNVIGNNCAIIIWNSDGAQPRSAANGQAIYRVNFRVLAASTNYWARFSSTCTPLEIVRFPDRTVTPVFTNLGNPPGASTLPVTLLTTSHTAANNSTVQVAVTARNFTSITSGQWSMKWDSTVLRFDSLTGFNNTLPLRSTNFTTTQAVSNGRLSVNWSAASGTRTLTDNDTLFKIAFRVIGNGGTSTQVQNLTTGASVFRSTSNGLVQVGISPQNGTVSVSGGSTPVTGLTFLATQASGRVGDTVCVRIFTKNFTNIASMNWSMRWDSTRASFVSARLVNSTLGTDQLTTVGGNSPNLIFRNPPSLTGTLTFLWQDATGLGVSFTGDSTAIYELCLRLTNSGTIPVNFVADPLKILILDADVNRKTANFLNGSINSTNAAAAINTSAAVTNVTCPGGTNGAVTLTATGGTGTFTYAWSGPSFTATTKDISNLRAGTYRVTVTSGSSTKVDSFVVTQPSAYAVTGNVTNVNCFGQNTGAITLNVSGATAPYTFRWNSGETTQNLSNKATGDYIVTITDARSCVRNDTFKITGPSAAIAFASNPSVQNVSCKGGANGAITISVTGGTPNYTYSWVGPNGYTSTAKDITSLRAGDYNLTVTDSRGCAYVAPVTRITEPDSIKFASNPSVQNVSCKGGTNGAITISVTGGTPNYTYNWAGPNSFTSTAAALSNLRAGDYNLTVTDSRGCTFTSTTKITEPDSVKFLNNPSVQNVSCKGASDGNIVINVTGGTAPYTYSWAGPNGFTATTKDIAGRTAGDYNVTVTDARGCTFSATGIKITEPEVITIGAATVVDAKCGLANGSISIASVTGGNGGYTFSWSGATTGTTQNLNNALPGQYILTVRDSRGCTATSSPITINNTGSTLNIGRDSIVNPSCLSTTGTIRVFPAGGVEPYTYRWSNGSTTSTTTGTAGNYTVTVSDGSGCSVTKQYTLTQADAISITTSVTPANNTCVGAIILNVSGGTPGYTYNWSGRNVVTNAKDQSNLCPGTYNVTVTDSRGCTTQRQIEVTGSIAPIQFGQFTVTPAGCPGQNQGAISFTFTGGSSPFQYEWYRLPNTTDVISRQQNITNLPAGRYVVKIIDPVQSNLSPEIEVKGSSSNIVISLANRQNETCAGSDGRIEINIAGGVPAYAYLWNDGSTSQTRNNLRAGNYTVTVTDANRCIQASQSFRIDKDFCPLVVVTANKSARCSDSRDGSITVNVQNGEPGYTIKWSNRDSVKIDNSPRRDGTYEIQNLAGGSYAVTVTDSRGQINVTNVTVDAPAAISINKTITPDRGTCNGSIVLAVTGGTAPYTYLWNDGQTSRDRFSLCNGRILSVQVTDRNGCTASTTNDTIKLQQVVCGVVSKNVNPLYNGFDIKCFGECNGSATVSNISNDFTAPFSFRWSSGESAQTAFRLCAGSQSVTVTDATGKTCILTTTINAPEKLDATVAQLTSEKGLEVVATGGVKPYTYQWTGTVDTSRQVKNLAGGDYTVLVMDKNGCMITASGRVPFATVECLRASSVVTPDGSGRNDNFEVEKCDFKAVRLEIYNRWGQMVYSNDNYTNQWQGRDRDNDQGDALPDGVYLYILKATESNGNQRIEKGTVTLLRK